MAKIKGTIFKKIEEKSGPKKNGEGNWIKCAFVIEIPHGKKSKKLSFTGWEDVAIILRTLKVGDIVDVTYEPESREYNGSWYTDLFVSGIDLLVESDIKIDAQSNVKSKPVKFEDDGDDLPF